MNPVDFIQFKRDGGEHPAADLQEWIHRYTQHEIPDYQMAAWLMAVFFKGMTDAETSVLTNAMMTSGDTIDLGEDFHHSADKHSTGGVGDKTSLVVLPLAAACGVKVAKMSGRGLGHTGGTIDKLEAIPGFHTALTNDEFLRQLRTIGLVLTGQTGNLVPADKLIYALRDVTATVDSLPLIAASIMSKKLAAGAKNIVLDVKYGKGAFMKTHIEAVELAKVMVAIGTRLDRQVVAYVTAMDQPLGRAIGNALEVAEAIATLKGKGPQDLVTVSIALAAEMVSLARGLTKQAAREVVTTALHSGQGLMLMRAMIKHQGGAWDEHNQQPVLPVAPVIEPFLAPHSGYFAGVNALMAGKIVMGLGAGRVHKEDMIDPRTGIVFSLAPGDFVQAGEPVAYVHGRNEQEVQKAIAQLQSALTWQQAPLEPKPLISARVGDEGVEFYQH